MNLGKSLLIAAYLAIQIAVPLRGLLRSKFETRGNFSWNMYANRYGCEVDYVLRRPDGTSERIDHRGFFRLSRRASMVFNGDALPHFHSWLCDQYRRDGALEGQACFELLL